MRGSEARFTEKVMLKPRLWGIKVSVSAFLIQGGIGAVPGGKGTEIRVTGKWQGGQLGRHQGGMARQARGLDVINLTGFRGI